MGVTRRSAADLPRELSRREREALLMLLPDGAFTDVEVYRRQAEHATVTELCPCGCPTIDISVDRDAVPRAAAGTPLLPVEAYAGDGEAHLELILFARSGYLESLELVYIDSYPDQIPAPEEWDEIVYRAG